MSPNVSSTSCFEFYLKFWDIPFLVLGHFVLPIIFLFKLIDKTNTTLRNHLKTIKEDDNKAKKTKQLQDIQYLLKFLNSQLTKLHSYFSFFEGKDNTPHIIRPYFEECFYQKKGYDSFQPFPLTLETLQEYSYYQYKNILYIASFHCTPFNIDYLKSFYKKYNQEKEQHSYDYFLSLNQYINKELQETQETYEIIKEEKIHTQEETANIKKETANIKTVTANIKKETANIKEDIQKNTIHLLGIFAAFLAFVTVNIGMVKIADNIYEYILYVLTFVFALSFFVFLIKHETLKENNIVKRTIFILLILLILNVIGYIFFDHKGYLTKQPNKEENTEKIQEAIRNTQEKTQEAIQNTQEKTQEAIQNTQEKTQEAIQNTQEKTQEAIRNTQEKTQEAIQNTQEKTQEAIRNTQEKTQEAIRNTQETHKQ